MRTPLHHSVSSLVLFLVALVALATIGSCDNSSTTQFSELPEEDPAVVADSPINSPRVVVDALIFDNNVYPVSMFRSVTGTECDEAAHWHSDQKIPSMGRLRDDLTAIIFDCENSEPEFIFPSRNCIEDTDPFGCGFGKVSEVTRQQVQMFQECVDLYPKVTCP